MADGSYAHGVRAVEVLSFRRPFVAAPTVKAAENYVP